jgi:hypothetical protein
MEGFLSDAACLARAESGLYGSNTVGTARVRVVEGPDRGADLAIPLGARVLVGRDADADLRLNDANVSQQHCALEHRISGVYVTDLESHAGTILNGQPVNGQPILVPEAADLQVGGTRLQVIRALPDEPTPEVPGVTLGRRLGAGSSGIVYEGVLDDSREAVAVKVLAPGADEVTCKRFEREAAILDRLRHPGIARVLRLLHVEGRPCMIRELVQGHSLESRVQEDGPLPWREAMSLGVAVAQALAQAHAGGVIHRDVKPANIMLDARGRHPKLIDFELAKRDPAATRSKVTRLTETGMGLGTLAYLAPEQLTDAREVGPAADVYGLGLTLYFAVSGEQPFGELTPEEFFQALYETGPRRLEAVVPGLPAPARGVLERAYARAEGDRFQDARSFAMALAQCLAGR